MCRKFNFDDGESKAGFPTEDLPATHKCVYGEVRGMIARRDGGYIVWVLQGAGWVPHPPAKPLNLEFKPFVEALQTEQFVRLVEKWTSRRYYKTMEVVLKLAKHLDVLDSFAGLLLSRMQKADEIDVQIEAHWADLREAARRRMADPSLYDFPPPGHDEYLSKVVHGLA